MKILLTGASGMLGHYIKQQFAGDEILALGRSEGNKIRCDLTSQTPDLSAYPAFDLVIHAAGTFREADAMDLNLEGTRRLLQALEEKKVGAMVYISSCDVYGRLEGEDIDETFTTVTRDKVGQSKILAEEEMRAWHERTGTPLTILRPTTMLGKDVKGWIEEMYNQVARGTYIHIRDSKGLRSLVTAYDVARVIKMIYRKGGIYNVTDGCSHELLKLAEAMSANRGEYKRMWALPAKWAALAAKLHLGKLLTPEIIADRSRSLTFSNRQLAETIDISFFNTLEVVARSATDYPYEDE